MSYCTFIHQLPPSDKKQLHGHYHDHLYGFPIHDDNELFGRLILEINQAGLSWETILKKEQNFRKAYDNFDIHKIAGYTQSDIDRLLNDAGIIRNKLKVNAAITNAKSIVALQKEWGSFEKWLAHHYSPNLADWIKLFKKHFKFVGGEIVNEFLMSIGYLPGAHDTSCPIHIKIIAQEPMWMKK